MNRRGKRLALGVVAVGLAVLLGFSIAYRKAILEHVVVWHFQLTRETKTIEPRVTRPRSTIEGAQDANGRLYSKVQRVLVLLSNCSGIPVIYDAEDCPTNTWLPKEPPRDEKYSSVIGFNISLDVVIHLLTAGGFRVIEQNLPRRAYVVCKEDEPVPDVAPVASWRRNPRPQ